MHDFFGDVWKKKKHSINTKYKYENLYHLNMGKVSKISYLKNKYILLYYYIMLLDLFTVSLIK